MKDDDELVASPMARAALYLRVSTGRQAEHDLSIPDQRRQAHSFCEGKGWTVVGEYVEPGASATDDRRPEFQRMMDAASCRPAEFDVIVVHSFSRFFRDQFQLEFYVRRLAKNGVRLVSITQDLGDDPMSVMMRQIMALFDEYQSKENAKHTLRAMRENARQGFWNGARPPFGYRIVDAEQRGARMKKKLDIDPDRAEVVRLIYRLARVGDGETGPLGTRRIADYLNERGIRTPTGGRFGCGAVHDILTRTTYIGTHRFNVYSWRRKEPNPPEEVVEVEVPAIISQEEFDEVGELLKSRASQLKAPRYVSAGTLLGGICHCKDCGGAMTLRTSGRSSKYRYYTCCTKARKGTTGCSGRTIPMSELDELVVEHLEERILAPERLRTILAGVLEKRRGQEAEESERIAALRRQAAAADAKLTRLYEAIEEGVADAKDGNLKSRIAELRTIRDSANADAERAEGRRSTDEIELTPELIGHFGKRVKSRLRRANGGFRRHEIQGLLHRVEVGEDSIHITGTTADLLQSLVAANSGVKSAAPALRSSVPKWLPGQDSNLRPID
ncbi:recombinase family protein [Sphingopyxis indica]|uniref:recombinase family protein n=1 Tax=Sphingopyxis indica TaxID=436663 RepID=UPI000B7961CE